MNSLKIYDNIQDINTVSFLYNILTAAKLDKVSRFFKRTNNELKVDPDLNTRVAIYFENNTAIAACYYRKNEGNKLYIEFIQVENNYSGFGVGTDFVMTLIKEENAIEIAGEILNTYSAFCFWEKIGSILYQEIYTDPDDCDYFNENDYDFEQSFDFDVDKGYVDKYFIRSKESYYVQ